MKDKHYLSIIGASATVVAFMLSYGIAYGMKLPLPLIDDGVFRPDYNEQARLIDQWENIRTYTHLEDTEISDAEKIKALSEQEFLNKYAEIDGNSFMEYISNNTDLVSSGYDKLVIDKVDKTNTETGIKTINGDNVIGLDVANNTIVIGVTVDGVQGKLVIVKNKEQVGLSVVDNVIYWDEIDKHATKENALLAINASDYTWNRTGNYGTVYGLTVRNGDTIRRAQSNDDIVGFDKDGNIQIGGDSSALYNGCEGTSSLISNSEVYISHEDNQKTSRAAIGQAENGDVLMLITDNGATLTGVANILKEYGATNAASLSYGKCVTMWWNGKIVNNTEFDSESGIKLPNAWVVRKTV